MTDDRMLTHKDLALGEGVSETTIKSYRRKFPRYLAPVNQGKPLRFEPVAARVCARIHQGFESGLSVEEVRARLAREFAGAATPDKAEASGPGQDGLALLLAEIRGLAGLQQEIAQRLKRLEQEFGVMSSALEQDRDNGTPSADSLQGTGRKVVRVRRADGEYDSYALERLEGEDSSEAVDRPGVCGTGDEPTEPAGAIDAPDAGLLELPLVVRTDEGEYLGVAGRSGRLTVQRMSTLLQRHCDAPAQWAHGGRGWTLRLDGTPAFVCELVRTVTPRGNEVALLLWLTEDGQMAEQEAITNFMRQLHSGS